VALPGSFKGTTAAPLQGGGQQSGQPLLDALQGCPHTSEGPSHLGALTRFLIHRPLSGLCHSWHLHMASLAASPCFQSRPYLMTTLTLVPGSASWEPSLQQPWAALGTAAPGGLLAACLVDHGMLCSRWAITAGLVGSLGHSGCVHQTFMGTRAESSP
jgi:hypothetical protein